MLSQDICDFHNAHAVYASYGGIVFGADEGKNIAKALGKSNKVRLASILSLNSPAPSVSFTDKRVS